MTGFLALAVPTRPSVHRQGLVGPKGESLLDTDIWIERLHVFANFFIPEADGGSHMGERHLGEQSEDIILRYVNFLSIGL